MWSVAPVSIRPTRSSTPRDRAPGPQIGSEAEVLVEGAGRRGASQARTRTNRIVHLHGTLEPGTFVTVRITDAAAHHLSGEVVPAPALV